MKVEDTTIQTAGVMRCCIASLGADLTKEVALNDKATCQYCKTEFTLVERTGPIWIPDWQLKEKA